MGPPLVPTGLDAVAQMNTFTSFVSMLGDAGAKDENKLKAAQELSENLEVIVSSTQYPTFLDHAMKNFLKILQDGEPLFIAEYNIQQVRKLILEMIHRLPTNDQLRPYVKQTLNLMFKLLEKENEDNVLICLRIIIELHKQYRPQHSTEIQTFLQFVKCIYRDLPNHLSKIFEPRNPIKIKDLSELNVEVVLAETFTSTVVMTETRTPDGNNISYNLIPKGILSLKVLQELPIIVVLMYQLYKHNVHNEVGEFIPLIMTTITLQPTAQQRTNPGFNREIFVDFIGAQIKTLSFLAYIIRIYQDSVAQQAGLMVKGILGLLSLCPMEVAHLRKELLIASRHILATELRLQFIPHMERLFDENLLFGKGWTTNESLRPLAYSILADLVHHVRQHLPMSDLSRAVHLFAKNVHDESLPTSIQTMSCKLLLNLVECIRQRSDVENGPGRDLLIEMLEVFVLKFKSIVKLQLPALSGKPKNGDSNSQMTTNSQVETPASPSLSWSNGNGNGSGSHLPPSSSPSSDVMKAEESSKLSLFVLDSAREEKKERKMKFTTKSASPTYSITECRSLVKTLVCGVKTITWGCAACKAPSDSTTGTPSTGKNLQPKETVIFIRLVQWAMKALDIYALNIPGTPGIEIAGNGSVSALPSVFASGSTSGRQTASPQTIRSKEEKEVLEHFAGVFAMMNPQTFKEVFATTVEYVVERIYRNSALQVVANSFLANPSTSAVFATILVEYLLCHMEEMGSNMERSNLYLKLFKLVFGSVSLFAAENEQMLKPHLPHIVNKSMELALSAKEPYNYFLLLRALFRSIGGGSHDLLYQEFLPLLPNLLQSLNSLQSGLHKQHMKDLFVELCLTVPVRLSSLLPYLPMLMDPLVSSLNGSQTLVSQGLRTLELCVDNLQPDFLYEHIQPVRAELMQALWRTLRNPNDQIAHVAFRVLGKFGGGNRKMMVEPQRLDYWDKEAGPHVVIHFQDLKQPVTLPVEKIMETAFSALKSSSTEPFYRRQCWEVVRCFLLSSLQPDDDRTTMLRLLSHHSFREGDIHPVQSPSFQCSDRQARHVYQTAVTAMFVAAAIKELRQAVLPTLVSLVRHYTLVAVVQQAGPFPVLVPGRSAQRIQGMDPLVLVDALATIMGHEEKELCKPGHLALVLMLDTASTVLGSKERACKLPLMEYLAERMCALCYDRAWYAKLGGCIAIKFLFERMAFKWVLEHQYVFLKALLFVMMDLTGEVSSGAVDMAKANLEKMLLLCAGPLSEHPERQTEEFVAAQKKSLHDVTHELVRQVTSPNSTVREQAMHLLQVLARTTNQTATSIMEPHKEVLADMVPPKKHLLRHQPINAQIGLMDGNTFCTTLRPRLFTIDLSVVEHKVFFTELLSLCENDDSVLLKLPCYKSVNNLTPLRKSALQALAACHYISLCRDKILAVIFKALSCNNSELQETAFLCMKKILTGTQIEMETVHAAVRPLLLLLGDYRSLSTNVILRLSHTTQLFPHVFNEKLCEQLLQHLRKWLEVVIVAFKTGGNRPVATSSSVGSSTNSLCSNEVKIAVGIIDLFHQIPAASARFLEILCKLVLQTERALGLEPGSPFREPLVKFLLRYPNETIELLFREEIIADHDWNRFLEHFIRHSNGKPFRDAVQQNANRLIDFVNAGHPSADSSTFKSHSLQVTVRVLHTIIRLDDQWIANQKELISALTNVWCSGRYEDKKTTGLSITERKEQRQMSKILLHYFEKHPDEVELLFNLLRALCDRSIPDYYFLKDFLEKTVCLTYGAEWKRAAFFKFVEMFRDPSLSQELKAKILQHVVIPGFASSFERGEGETLIGTPPTPDQDNNDSVVSVFINRVIDPDNPFGTSDAVRILLLQLSCLLVEQASQHIHDAANKRQGNKLRRLMTFAWPCLLSKNCVDPTTRYHGHLLLSHIIAKFAIHKRIVLQVFHSLLKAHAVEARSVVRQALEILTPAMPLRMEDGNTMLTHWTKKIIVEEGHTIAQLVHILQLLVRHYKVYYPVRHHLVQYMVNSIQRLGFTPTATLEHKKLAVELAEVVLKWELQRMKDETDSGGESSDETSSSQPAMKRNFSSDGVPEPKKPRLSTSNVPGKMAAEVNKPIDKSHCDAIANFLLRLACQVNDASNTATSTGEQLSKRCVALLKMALKPNDVWPNCELKLAWFDRLFQTVDNPAATATPVAATGAANQPNYTNICTALELLTFLLTILRKEQILAGFKPLQRGLASLMNCTNPKVIRCLHGLLSRLMSIFPTEPTNSNVASKHEELEGLYASVTKAIYEGLGAYERNATASSSMLLGTLMLLKSACTNNPCYIDRLITSFMRALQRMTREHLVPSAGGPSASTSAAIESGLGSCDLLILSLDLVKNRVGVMGVEMRKAFIGSILVGLLEKSTESRVVRAIVRMLDEWMRTKTPIAINQGPSLREKSILLVKMMQCLEKRFPDDVELNIAFLELINFVYREESLKGSELVSKLEPAFLAGLRCPQSSTRAKFFEVLDTSMRRRLHDRLLYIVCSQNWEGILAHYWIKQCLELILVTSVSTAPIHTAPVSALLPSVTSVIASADANERETFTVVSNIKEEPEELLEVYSHVKEDDIDMDLSNVPTDPMTPSSSNNKAGLATLVNRQIKFLDSGREVTCSAFLEAVAQLAHMDTPLAEALWLDLFPRIWKVLGERQQQALSVELVPFLCSGAHVIQKDCHPSAINTFAEALSLCVPPIRIKPCLLKYLGKSHNLWHRMTLMLEQLAYDGPNSAYNQKVKQKELNSEYDFESGSLSHHETLDALSEMYSTLKEEDLWSGLWQRRAHFSETVIAVAYEQQGFFEQAQGSYELAMTRARQEFSNAPAPASLQSEYRLLEEHWIRCSKELNQWDLLQEFGGSPGCINAQLVLESAWRTPNWPVVRDALTQLEQACPKEYAWKVNLYRGFLAMCHPEEQHPNMVERYVELASSLCIREWRRLPAVVSHVHLPTLQAAQQVVELQEAAQIHQGLLQARPGTLHDVKAIVKTWRNRLPVIADDLSHWSDVFTWRQHHYQFIVSHYDQQGDQQANAQSMLGVHASAQAIIHFGKVARKHNLTGVCLDSLARIYSIPSVPIVDCFQKIRQQVKCYLQAANVLGRNELQEGLEVIESTNLKYFAKEMTAELYALKGMLLAQIGRADDSNKAFSAAVQMHDTLVKAWALWGDHLEQVFTKDPRNLSVGVSAITCFLHACRHQNESKSRKYLAKVLWLLTYDDEKLSLAEAMDKYCVGVPPVQWLPWIPQLLVCLVRNEGKLVLNLLSQVGRMFPQAVYFPIRTLYLTLKIEQRERFKSAELAANSVQACAGPVPQNTATPVGSGGPGTSVATINTASTTANAAASSVGGSSVASTGGEGAGPIRATAPMWRCSRIMHMQRDLHPTVLSSLEGIVDQMVWFRENWYEEVLRQLRQGLAKCYAIAFENRGTVADATITPHTLSFVKKLVATFGIGIENIANSASGSFSSAASESLARRAQATAQDPVFQRMKTQFSTDFDFTLPGAMKLHNLIHKLKKWIKILEAKTKLLPRSFLIEEKCRFLSNFNLQTAEVELPGEFLLPKHTHYYVRIARFLPRVEIVQKHNTAARRLYIRGHNGKIYPYLVVNDAGLGDARREERVLQLLRMLNHYLNKHKETSKRFLNFTVPRVVAVSPQMRLVEDNPTSVTLLDVYRQRCAKRNIEHDMPIAKYYERLATVQARGSQASHPVLRDIHKDVQQMMVPRNLLREWAISTFPSATSYWTFRKMFTLQIALVNLAEYVLHLTRLNADMLYLHQDSGLLSVAYFKFDVDDITGELDANRPVPFRLTPNMADFLTIIGVAGPLTASMIAAARCLVQPSAKVAAILKAILRDEMIAWHKKKNSDEREPDSSGTGQVEGELLISMVNKAVTAIIGRLQGLSTFDGNESKVSTLVAAANSNDNLCRMDPAWHPWL